MTALPPVSFPAKRGLVLLVIACFFVGATCWVLFRKPQQPTPNPSDAPPIAPDDPRRTYSGPFLNIRPEVQYVGDAACQACHGPTCDKYHQHPMGRSMSTPRAVAGATAFEAANLRYEVKHADGVWRHREFALAADGSVLAERSEAVQYVMGSGARGHSYLFERDGFVFQSPISWYASRQALDLSPGYRERHAHFDRAVPADCVFCHANQAAPVRGTINRYEQPVLQAIGCERCHGPGELHVRKHATGAGVGKGVDHSIVNPKHLEPNVREAVCHQCHLQGQARVLRPGREIFDFRPGLPLDSVLDVFVWHPDVPHGQKVVGHVEQMAESKCFQASAGKMGCVSCHDPHEKPEPAKRLAHYRDRCLTCHNDAACKISRTERLGKNQNDCAACHMPPVKETDIVHVSVTDHRIPRRSQAAPPVAPKPPQPPVPLTRFPATLKSLTEDEAGRNLGLGLAQLAEQTPAGPARQYFAQLAATQLRRYGKLESDPMAQLALATAYRRLARFRDGLELAEAVLRGAPRNEATLVEAATLAGEMRQDADAIGYWRRAIDISPQRWQYHHQLALSLMTAQQLEKALAACTEAKRWNPVQADPRLVEVSCLLELGRTREATQAFEDAMALKPPRAEELRQWFRKQVQPSGK